MSNPHKEIKSTAKGDYINKHKIQYKYILAYKYFLLQFDSKYNYIEQ